MNKASYSEGILSDPLLYASLQSTIRHYLSGYLHQFLVTYADGLLPVPLSLENMWHVLNVPCCSGDWACDIAYQNPLMEVVGIDPDPRRIAFAQAQASAQGIANATFQVGRFDALSPPDQYYDLLHIRFLAPLVRQDGWKRITAGWWELCRPGGLVMWMEMRPPVTNSSAFTDWCSRLVCLAENDGMTADVTPRMAQLLSSAGFQPVRQAQTTIDISSNTRLHKHACMHIWDVLNFVHCNLLFSRAASPSTLHDLYEQMIQDFLSEQFQGGWTFDTYLAIKEI
ncbi:MAG TPA: class I SAM-dependent methyltransferase [Ktedonobacteraceae bacterium]|jgi:ubiquinone/menaquinone biosynthesis C-methylase UbiE|nr:class I SAM-dependent methyltransferase [Ktedonobacteraceae bacterium]